MKQVLGAKNWFNNIVGIIEGFVEYELANPGSWLSIVDAAILQGIQDGYAQSAGLVADPGANPGGTLWRRFFDALGRQADDAELIALWGSAEMAATNYGVNVAAGRGLAPNKYEWLFLQTGNLYRRAIASFEGGLGTSVNWIGTGLGVLAGAGDGRLLPDRTPPPLKNGASTAEAGNRLGAFFIDPRALWNGRSPVYWYSTTLIWANQRAQER